MLPLPNAVAMISQGTLIDVHLGLLGMSFLFAAVVADVAFFRTLNELRPVASTSTISNNGITGLESFLAWQIGIVPDFSNSSSTFCTVLHTEVFTDTISRSAIRNRVRYSRQYIKVISNWSARLNSWVDGQSVASLGLERLTSFRIFCVSLLSAV